MARFAAARMLAVLALVGLAARGASAAIPIPSILSTTDGGAVSFIDLKNVSNVIGIDTLSGDFTFTANVLDSYADSKFLFTLALTEPGNKFRIFLTDLATFSKPKVLGSILTPVNLNPSCLVPGITSLNKLMAITKTGSTYKIQITTHCRTPAARKCRGTTGQTTADVITVYQFNYAALPGKFGLLSRVAVNTIPVRECTRATLISTRAVAGNFLILTQLYDTKANGAKSIGRLAVFRVLPVLGAPKLLSFSQTFTVKTASLFFTAAVAGSPTSIFAVAHKGRTGQDKIYSWAPGRNAYIGGYVGAPKLRSYDSITTIGADVYSAIVDLNGPDPTESTPGRIVLTTEAQLKAGTPGGTTITTDVAPFGVINYVADP